MSHVIRRSNQPTRAGMAGGFGGILEAALMEVLEALPDRPPQIRTTIHRPALESHSVLPSTRIPTRPQTLKLNPDPLGILD